MSRKGFLFIFFFVFFLKSFVNGADYVVSNTDSFGEGSFRAAIEAANNSSIPRPFEIVFSIPAGSVIHSNNGAYNASKMEISRPVIIDGTQHPAYSGSPVISYIGSGYTNSSNWSYIGIFFSDGSDGSVIKGIHVAGFKYGITVKAGNCIVEENLINKNLHGIFIRSGASGTVVRSNLIGTNSLGTVENGNLDGIIIENSTDVTIGGASVNDGNLISGNEYKGIWVKRNNKHLLISNNKIGTDINGQTNISNKDGVFFSNEDSVSNVRLINNVISGNTANGLFFDFEYGTVKLNGNLIGTDYTGSYSLPNPYGIYSNSFSGTLIIGDTSKNGGNVISGNTKDGVFFRYGRIIVKNNIIGFNKSLTTKLGNGRYGLFSVSSDSCVIGGDLKGEGNFVGNHNSGSSSAGIFLYNTNNAIVKRNIIGTNLENDVASNTFGVILNNSHYAKIEHNVVTGSVKYNLQLSNSNDCEISGNYIGTDIDGQIKLNYEGTPDGINLYQSSNVTIGGEDSLSSNVISGNHNGVFLLFSHSVNILNNFIGTDKNGLEDVPNSNGVYYLDSDAGSISGNMISANTGIGICLDNGSDQCSVLNNKIGLNSNNSELGNGEEGILIKSSFANTIKGNTVCSNEYSGVGIVESSYNYVYNNFIGTDSSGTRNLRNKGHGVVVESGTSNKIGGSSASQGNVIAYNLGNGVNISGSDKNLISGNSIFYNGAEKGINLNLLDGDNLNNGNSSKQKPVVTAIDFNSGVLNISGTALDQDTIQFFVSDDDGEDGLRFLPAYTTLVNGTSWAANIPIDAVSGGYIVATAIDSLFNTSEFSTISGITNCPTEAPQFSISFPCPGKPLITEKETLFSVENFEPGYTYSWDMDGDGAYEVSSSSSNVNYSFFTGGSKSISVWKRIANCAVVSPIQDITVQDLQIDADNSNLCEGEVASISVEPDNLSVNDYVWYRNGDLLDHSGPNLQVDNWGDYTVKVTSWSCDDEASISSHYALSDIYDDVSASKTIMVVERVCGKVSYPGGVGGGKCIGQFLPEPNKKYVLSAWVMEDDPNFLETYERGGIKLDFHVENSEGDATIDESVTAFHADPNEEIIDGWQRIEDVFTVPPGSFGIDITLLHSSEVDIYYDDIRIHPLDANSKTYVYDPVTFRLMAVLDENNYASFYEYDQEGKLIRVKKETSRGVMTIQENVNNTYKRGLPETE